MATATAKATLLIVDDEPDVREVLEEYFVSHGYAAKAAENASCGEGAGLPRIPSTSRCSTSTCRAKTG
jgi:CheY-like chemotaxis protein